MPDERNERSLLPPQWFVRLAWFVHRGLYRITGGRFGLRRAKTNRWGMMRLTTTGRRSGQERSVILGYLEDGPNLVTMAMNGWADPEPAWWLNLQATITWSNTMTSKGDRVSLWHQCQLSVLVVAILILSLLAGCGGPSPEELGAVDYAPLPGGDWQVSTPAEHGLDPMLLAEFYLDAAELETIYGLLVVKDGQLIAEDYFNVGSVEQKALVQSVAKSFTSALVGIALDQGCLSGVDQKMIDFFPDFADQIVDPRKNQITLRDMLQMRAGYPPEEDDPELWEAVWSGDYVHLVADAPLSSDPGTEFQYSNLTTHWLGIVAARACDTDLQSLAQTYLFDPMGGEVGDWRKDVDGYNWAAGELHVSARDAAKFGMLYLNDGEYEGTQVISADWVHDSLQTYSEDAYGNIGDFRNIGYGYQWWSAQIGDYDVNFAWGHGGQLIVLVDELDMAVVVTADPFYDVYGSESWQHEKANFQLVGSFIDSLS